MAKEKLKQFPIHYEVISYLENSKIPKICKWMSFLWGIGVLTISIFSIYKEPCLPGSTLETYPWFTSKCNSIILVVDCQYQQIPEEKADEYLFKVPASILVLDIRRHCSLMHQSHPHVLQKIPELNVLYLINSSMKDWNESWNPFPDKMNLLHVQNSTMDILPSIFEKIPLFGIYLMNTNTKMISSNLDRNMKFLRMEGNEITEFPIEILSYNSLGTLQLNRNQIKELPQEIIRLPLERLYLDYNQLQELPNGIEKMTTLKILTITGNPITKLPAQWNEPNASIPSLEIGETPLCEELNKILKEDFNSSNRNLLLRLYNENPDICKASCQKGCPRNVLKNQYCDSNCNVTACNFDNEKCLFLT